MRNYFLALIIVSLNSPSVALSQSDLCDQPFASSLYPGCDQSVLVVPQGDGQSGYSEGEWERQEIEYPQYGLGVPKPWDENEDLWNDYFSDNYDLACGQNTFQGVAKCATAWAELTRFGYCFNLKQYEATGHAAYREDMDAWVQNSDELDKFVRKYNTNEPSREFWACN